MMSRLEYGSIVMWGIPDKIGRNREFVVEKEAGG